MMGLVWLCARHELLLATRSRWLHWFAVVFAGLALLVAASGYVLTGGYGLQDFARTAVSLVQLVLLIVPLAALIFGSLTLSPDRGAAELLYAQPVPRWAIRRACSTAPPWPSARRGAAAPSACWT